MNKHNRVKAVGLGLAVALICSSVAQAQERPTPSVTITINQSRGADARVDYDKLSAIGPWDDRNYRLTADEVALLSKREADAIIAIPAFYRVEMRKANPDLPQTGPGQYPRSALNGYLAKYEGYQVDGVLYTSIRTNDAGGYELVFGERASGQVMPNFLAGNEKRVTTPAGASESAVAINPVNTNLVIAGTNGPGSGQKMWQSTDGGVTWGSAISLASTCCDPTVGWSPDGTIAYAGALSTVVGSGTNVLFYRSTNNGASWTLAKTISTGNVSDKEYLHVDTYATSPRKGNIYMAWHENNVQKFSRSTDTGITWASNLTIDSASRGIGSDLMSDKSGNVYFVFPTTSGGSNAKQIRVAKSTDGGATFAAAVNAANLNADFDYPIPAMETRRAFVYVSTQADTSAGTFGNSLYICYNDTNTTENNTTASANHSIVKVLRSRDGGATWASSIAHSTADVSTVDRFNPWMSVDKDGRVFVMFYDTRNSSGRSGTDLYYSVSSDGGVTFSTATRLTAVTSKNIVEANEWGDYNGMDAQIADIMAIYTDNRDETGGTAESKDVYVKGGFSGPPGNISPTANFTFTTSSLTANFTDSSSDSDGTIASRSWNFGDSTTSTATNPSKTYATAGTYSVTLTVTDNLGATNAKTSSVTVGSVPSFFENLTDFAINDNSTINSPIVVSGRSGNAPATLAVAVRILHTYQGDLKVDLVAPDGTLYNIHNRTGAGTDNIIKTVTINASSEVANGTWNLRVNDNANADIGTLDSWSMQF